LVPERMPLSVPAASASFARRIASSHGWLWVGW
jgi:hypothetical protein